MTDSTTRLREALSQIAADHTDDAPDPATLDAIWRAGRRRRWRARAGVVATLGVVALLVLGAFVPWGVPTVAVPATPPGVPLASYPEHVAMPWRPHVTSSPGLTSLVVPGTQEGRVGVYAIGPDGSVSFVSQDDETAGFPPSVIPGPALAVSPDGRWLATASALLDVVSGERVGITPDLSVEETTGRGASPSWNPDSSRVLYPTVPSLAGAEAVVVDLAGGVQDVPPAGVGDALLLAGWTDEETVVGLCCCVAWTASSPGPTRAPRPSSSTPRPVHSSASPWVTCRHPTRAGRRVRSSRGRATAAGPRGAATCRSSRTEASGWRTVPQAKSW